MNKLKYQISLFGIFWLTVSEETFYKWKGWKRVRGCWEDIKSWTKES